jgi:16S rRNA (cytosine1402-N4)-methyltransferase
MDEQRSERPQLSHAPVLPDEVLSYLAPTDGALIVDGTVGAGGHAAAILAAADCHLVGLDRDDTALALAAERLSEFSERTTLIRTNFVEMAAQLQHHGVDMVDGILLDLGLSSMQLDEGRRGFSFRMDGPLDMRMDRREHVTASTLLNHAERDELTQIFRQYGEEPAARRLATAIVRRRDERPWQGTAELADLIRGVTRSRGGHSPALARCFQALRIAVNGELDDLRATLDQAVDLLAPGGRLVIISFHSLEDRIVKQTFRELALTCICPTLETDAMPPRNPNAFLNLKRRPGKKSAAAPGTRVRYLPLVVLLVSIGMVLVAKVYLERRTSDLKQQWQQEHLELTRLLKEIDNLELQRETFLSGPYILPRASAMGLQPTMPGQVRKMGVVGADGTVAPLMAGAEVSGR